MSELDKYIEYEQEKEDYFGRKEEHESRELARSLQLYYWSKENAFEEDSDMTIHNPRFCYVIDHREACDELNELLRALHDAINRPKGVVPQSAEKFYQQQP